MPSSERRVRSLFAAASLAVALGSASVASAQTAAQGFAVDRLAPAPAGAGWITVDDVTMHGGLGGAIGAVVSYASRPLRVATTDGSQRLTVVSSAARADLALAVTYDRLRVSLDFTNPLSVVGHSDTVGGYAFTAPALSLGRNADVLSDVRVGFDARLAGAWDAPFRLGVSADIFVPSGSRSDYDTDSTYRGVFRALVAGDAGPFTYAVNLGVHVRPVDDAPVPGSPRGSEMLFSAAVGGRFDVGRSMALVVGPEVFGQTAFAAFFGKTTTGLEGLLTERLEGLALASDMRLRLKVGVGAGLDPHFGAAEWRAVGGVELVGLGASSR